MQQMPPELAEKVASCFRTYRVIQGQLAQVQTKLASVAQDRDEKGQTLEAYKAVIEGIGDGSIDPDDCEEKYVLRPHTAMNFPKGKPYGLWNEGDVPASLVLSFTPPPRGAKNPREMRELLEKRGRSVKPPEEMNAMAGPLLAE